MIVLMIGGWVYLQAKDGKNRRIDVHQGIFILAFNFYHTPDPETMAETGNNMNNPAHELLDTPPAPGTPYISDSMIKYAEPYGATKLLASVSLNSAPSQRLSTR